MGNSQTPKKSRSPSRLAAGIPSGAGLAGPPEAPAEMGLLVPLVDVDPEVLRGQRIGTPVRVVPVGPRLEVLVRTKRLGTIAPDFQAAVSEFGMKAGVVALMDLDSRAVTVRLGGPG